MSGAALTILTVAAPVFATVTPAATLASRAARS